MAQQVIDVGTSASDGTGDPLRNAFTKINDNFTELYSTVENEGLTYGNISSNVAGITFNVTRYTESYSATPVLRGVGQVVGNVYLITGNVLGGTTPLNDVKLTVTTLANATVGNIATVAAVGIPVAPVLRVNGLTGNVTLTVNNITGAASKAYVNAAIAANIANVTGTVTDSLRANITAANAVISNHESRIGTLESNAAAQATAITNLTNTRATIAYVDTSIDNALSSNAILANVAAVNANVSAANAAILLRANLTGANFSGNITANSISTTNFIRTDTYLIAGSEINQSQGEAWANPAALFFGNTVNSPGPGGNRYYQVNIQNLDPEGTSEFTATADDGNDSSNYVSFGVAGSALDAPFYPYAKPHDAFVFATGGNLKLVSNTHAVHLITGNVSTAQVILTETNILQLNSGTVIKFTDGTIQSTAFGGNANLSSLNANITAANAAITSLQANAASQALDLNSLLANAATQAATIETLVSNAGTQAASLNSINANIGAFQTFSNANASTQTASINTINANIIAANLQIATLASNATVQALEIDNLQSNAQSQQGNIIALQSNSAAQAIQIDLLNANVTAANTNITSLSSNAATQGSQINLINANVIAANLNIVALTTNAAVQALALDNLQTNVNFYLSNVDAVNANVSAANLEIGKLNSNITAANSAIIALQTNAASQAVSINLLNTYSANLSNSVIFNGNVRSDYLLANANVITTNGIFESLQDTNSINYPGLASRFIGNVNGYYQIVLQNMSSADNASGDIVVTADTGNDTINYITMGINSSTFNQQWQNTRFIENALDGYIECVGGNIAVRTLNNVFLASGNTIVVINDQLTLGANCNLRFQDGSIQRSAITDVPGLYANIGTLSLFQSNIVGNASYTPNNASNYNATITNIQQALDELAARLRALGG